MAVTLEDTFLEDCEDGEDDIFHDDDLLYGNSTEKKELQSKTIELDENLEDINMYDDMEPIIDIDEIDLSNKELNMYNVKSISDLLNSKQLINHLNNINIDINKNINNNEPNYKLIETSNMLIHEINSHISRIHKFIIDIYSTKFAELQEMVLNPIEYAKCVKIIGNKKPEEMADLPLRKVLTNPSVAMMINVTATTTIGKTLSEGDLLRVINGCDTILELDNCKTRILNYLSTKTKQIAPNLSELIGSELTAKLVTISGGIDKLSKIPACNIQVLGQNKKTNFGYTMQITKEKKHFGIISECDLMKMCPNNLKQKCLRLIASKIALCSSVDAHQNNSIKNNNNTGILKRQECINKILKWQQPLPPKPIRPIAIPDNKPKKKRGGKRYRKMREKYKITETQRMQNRMAFNKPEDEVIDGNGEMIGLGMLGNASDVGGKLRTVKSKTQNSVLHKLHKRALLKQKKLKLKAEKAGTITGLHTSVIFTAVQGIELSNPDKKNINKDDDNNKYFSTQDLFAKKKM